MNAGLLRDIPSLRMARIGAIALVSVLGVATISGNASAEIVTFVNSWGQVEKVDTDNPGEHAMPADSAIQSKAGPVTFNVVYNDVVSETGYGFDSQDPDPTYGTVGAARQAAVQRVLAYISSALNENGTCDIVFSRSVHGTSLGLATGGTYFGGRAPAFVNGYAFQHITTNVDPSPSVADISLTFYFDFPSYAGTGTPSYNQYDLDTVLLHEITRGLGIVSLSDATGRSTASPYLLSRWDSYLETGSQKRLFDSTTASFLGVASDLTGAAGGVYFTGIFATQMFGGKPPVYAPSTFQSGVSLGYWDVGGKIAGDAVMEPSVTVGTVLRAYAPVDLGALKDIGYGNVGTPFMFVLLPAGGWFEIGQSVTMHVAAVGTEGTVTYQWTKDGSNILDATNSYYTINSLALYHAGDYTCIVTDEGSGPHETPPAEIKVFPANSLPTTGIVGLAIVAVACIIAGALIILRRE